MLNYAFPDPTIQVPPRPSNYLLSIHGGHNATTGFIDVKSNDQTGVMCAWNWNLNSADVVCRNLGRGYLNAYSSKGRFNIT